MSDTQHDPEGGAERRGPRPGEGFFEDFFLNEYDRLRSGYDQIGIDIAAVRRSAWIVGVATAVVLFVLAFFGKDRLDSFDNGIEARIAAALDSGMARLDSTLEIEFAQRIDSLTAVVASLRSETDAMSGQLDATSAELASREAQLRREFASLSERIEEGQTEVSRIEALFSQLRTDAEAYQQRGTDLDQLQRAELERIFSAMPVNTVLSQGQLPFPVPSEYQSRYTHDEYEHLIIPLASTGEVIDAFVQLTPRLAGLGEYIIFVIGTRNTEGQAGRTLCWRYHALRGERNRLQCSTILEPGRYQAWILVATRGEDEPLFYGKTAWVDVR